MERRPAVSVSVTDAQRRRTQAAFGARLARHRPDIIDNAIDEWHGRLRDCVRAKGGHFEQMLSQY